MCITSFLSDYIAMYYAGWL